MTKIHCSFDYICPSEWQDLQGTSADIRHCDHCKQDVYRARSEDEFNQLAQQGKCVAFEMDGIDYLGTPDGSSYYSE